MSKFRWYLQFSNVTSVMKHFQNAKIYVLKEKTNMVSPQSMFREIYEFESLYLIVLLRVTVVYIFI